MSADACGASNRRSNVLADTIGLDGKLAANGLVVGTGTNPVSTTATYWRP